MMLEAEGQPFAFLFMCDRNGRVLEREGHSQSTSGLFLLLRKTQFTGAFLPLPVNV